MARANVAELNHLARERWQAEGRVSGPELVAPGGSRYAAGDRVVTLAPSADDVLVTSERGVVESVDPHAAGLLLRMANDRLVHLDAADAGADRLDHGYALTVHRSQGDTTTTAHRFADGGGRELGYVSMSRAIEHSTVYVVADDLGQAHADLVGDWSAQRRQRWAIDTGTPARHAVEVEDAPAVPSQVRDTLREARLRSERNAVARDIPPDVSQQLRDGLDQLARAHDERDRLEHGSGGHMYTSEGRAGYALHRLEYDLDDARHRSADRRLPRSERRTARRQIDDLTPQVEAAAQNWHHLAGPRHAAMTRQIDDHATHVEELRGQHELHQDWIARHPEALPRLARIDRELDAFRPAPTVHRLAVGMEPPSPSLDLDLDVGGPELDL